MKDLSLAFMLFVVIGLLVTGIAYADNTDKKMGRYIVLSHALQTGNEDLLAQTAQVRFPHTVVTLKDAIQYLLRHSGFALIDEEKWHTSMAIMLNKPLPLINRQFGPISLRAGVSQLAGNAFLLVDDSINRTITFELLPDYQAASTDSNNIDP